jgi:MoaA/NifB/PqqE/SkfB family radical SAM enzyme
MRLKNKIFSAYIIVSSKLFKRKIPLAIRWQLTNRCTSRCKYCNVWKTKSYELTTKQIFNIIDELSKMGTQRISFSGGDPMLRQDIGKIIDYCSKKGISTSMNSSGNLIKERINDLKNLDLLKLSLDGPKEIHDSNRCKGSYSKVIEAVETAKKNNLRFTFATTLTKFNINQIDFLLNKGKEYNTVVAFQPLKVLYMGIKMQEINEISPSRRDFKKVIKRLIKEKKKGNKNIRNSIRELYYIYNWPNYKRINCAAGNLFCMIETNGDVIPCDRIYYDKKPLNCLKDGFKKAFKNMPNTSHCTGCGFCGALELSYLGSFKFDIFKDIKRFV